MEHERVGALPTAQPTDPAPSLDRFATAQEGGALGTHCKESCRTLDGMEF